jgi:hypothetical protein
MSHVANATIGNEEERGISGGQRKRVNIGMELVAEPSVLFLDEPTSGLDSSTSFDVCHNLRNLARQQGLTVAAVIHSPSPATFRQFDDFLLLGKGGRIVYMGPREEALAYFESIGFTCPPDESPSDFFMDVVSGLVPSEYSPDFEPGELARYWTERHNNIFANKRRMTREQAQFARRQKMQSEQDDMKLSPTFKFNDYYGFTDYIAAALASIIRSVYFYSKDLLIDFGSFLMSIIYLILQKPDPIRETAPFYMKGWFLMRRAAHQVYRTPQATLIDLGLNFTAGSHPLSRIVHFYCGPEIWIRWWIAW